MRYVSCSDAGIRRVKRGGGFVYLLPNGLILRDERKLQRIRKLALPPAWTNVWICPDPRGHLQATGYDSKGRKQYRYNSTWRNVRDDVKYSELITFAQRLPRLRRRLARDLATKSLTKDKVLATVVTVMARTGLRVGNARYAEENGSYGLTTLLDRHAHFHGASVEFSFRGKGGKPYQVRLRDRRLAAIVKRCRDIPGQRLFQYLAPHGRHRAISSTDVNAYLKMATGEPFTAKTFRTWTATLTATALLSQCEPSPSAARDARQINQVLQAVALQLGNTPAICRKSYVDPRVLDAFSQRKLQRYLQQVASRPGLSHAESGLVQVLKATARVAATVACTEMP